MKIEKILDKLAEKRICVLIMKANQGYSAVPVDRKTYSKHFLMETHRNGETIEEALSQLLTEK